jgi:hypothetical protein
MNPRHHTARRKGRQSRSLFRGRFTTTAAPSHTASTSQRVAQQRLPHRMLRLPAALWAVSDRATPPSTVDARETFGRRGRRPSPSASETVTADEFIRRFLQHVLLIAAKPLPVDHAPACPACGEPRTTVQRCWRRTENPFSATFHTSGTERPRRRRKSAISAASRLDCDTKNPPCIAPAGCPESGTTVLAAPSTLGNAGRKRPATVSPFDHRTI